MSSSLSLYNIAEELLALKQLRDDAEYEGDAEAIKVIDGQIQEWVKGCLAAKADGIRGYLRQLEEQRATWKEESDRFARLAKQAEAQCDRLKAYVLDAMRLLDAKTISGSKGDVLLSRRGNGGVKPLVIAQPELVPDHFQRVVITMTLEQWGEIFGDPGIKVLDVGLPEPATGLIRAELEAGRGVPGCRLEGRGEHVVIS